MASFQDLALIRQAGKKDYQVSKIRGFPQGRIVDIPKKEFLERKRKMGITESVDADIQLTGIIKNNKRIPKKFVIGIRKDLKGARRKEAISHEIGHYFSAKFRLGEKIRSKDKDIKSIIKRNPDFKGRKEEVIADVIGQSRINKSFKNKLKMKHPGLFKKIKEAI